MISLATVATYASQVAGTPTTLSCDAPSTFSKGEMGYVVWIDGQVVATIHVPRQTCTDLEHVDASNQIDPAEFLTVTHEAEHIALDSQNECDVEGAALANAWQFVRLFRLAAWRTRAILANLKYADAQLLPQYHTGCSS